MDATDNDTFSKILQEMAAMYRGTIYNSHFAAAYQKILKPYSMEAIQRACLDLMGNEFRKDIMPSAAEIKVVARKYEPKQKPARVDLDEERWRRRYDIWQRGQWSTESLELAHQLTDEELGIGQEGDKAYIGCEEADCPAMIDWPSASGSLLCSKHRMADHGHGRPITRQEKVEIFETLTPKGRAFLRACLPQLMKDIAVTPEEAALSDGPQRQIPPMLNDYLKRVDGATAQAVLDNYHNRFDYQED